MKPMNRIELNGDNVDDVIRQIAEHFENKSKGYGKTIKNALKDKFGVIKSELEGMGDSFEKVEGQMKIKKDKIEEVIEVLGSKCKELTQLPAFIPSKGSQVATISEGEKEARKAPVTPEHGGGTGKRF